MPPPPHPIPQSARVTHPLLSEEIEGVFREPSAPIVFIFHPDNFPRHASTETVV
jgi:hypothetical protein